MAIGTKENDFNSDSHLIYFDIFSGMINMADKNVLEIGGAIDPKRIREFRPKSWTAIDINAKRFDECLGGRPLPEWYKAIVADAANLEFRDDSFDIIYSTDCYEHVSDLNTILRESYRVLTPGGILFSKFAPIWSGPVGHHLWIIHDRQIITFHDELIPAWGHLLHTRDSMAKFLNKELSPELTEKIVRYIYDSNDINRLTDFEFEAALDNTEFEKIVFIRLKSPKKLTRERRKQLRYDNPQVIDFRTDGYFWVLAKPPLNMTTRLTAWVGLITSIPRHYGFKRIFQKLFH